MSRNEYQAPTVGQARCTYSNLASIFGSNTSKAGAYTVPALCPNNPNGPSYPPTINTFSHGQTTPSCGGYFSMKGAYPFANCTSCNASYTTKPCNGPFTYCNPKQ